MKTRENYLEFCKQMIADNLQPGKTLIQYVRTKKGQPRGVVVAFLDPDSKLVRFGWSLCNIKVDKFDKTMGLAKAVERAEPMYYWNPDDTPTTVIKTAKTVLRRAVNFFQPQKG